jgi:hypothetical protein
MADTDEQTKWRAGFDEAGEREVHARLSNPAHMNHQPQRQFAYRWLREQETARILREQQMHCYVRWTLWVAVAAVIVGIIGVVVTWLH